VAVFNVVDGLSELIGISFDVNVANQLGTLTLLQHIFQLILGQGGTRQFHLSTDFLFTCLSEKKLLRIIIESICIYIQDQLQDVWEQRQGAQQVGHIHIEGDTDQLRQTNNNIENCPEMFMNLEKSIMNMNGNFQCHWWFVGADQHLLRCEHDQPVGHPDLAPAYLWSVWNPPIPFGDLFSFYTLLSEKVVGKHNVLKEEASRIVK
jgi:hypothetical protein